MTVEATDGMGSRAHPRPVRRAVRWLWLLAAAVVIAASAGSAGYWLAGDDEALPAVVDGDTFQSVVLSNDRVYFGRLQGRQGDFYVLRDVYFVREQPGADGAEAVREVVPLSAELQQPQDHLLVRADHLVLVQDLEPGSEVLRTIERLERG